MVLKTIFISLLFICTAVIAAPVSKVELPSETGDSFVVQRLKTTGELWGSFSITNDIIASFAKHELIVVQVDQHKPIKLNQDLRSCGAPAGAEQQVEYQFLADESGEKWGFSSVESTDADVLNLFGWDHDTYQHIKADRRAEVIDFPFRDDEGSHALIQQLQQGDKLVFRYVTDEGEARQAEFDLQSERAAIIQVMVGQ